MDEINPAARRASPALSSFWHRSCLPMARSVSILASMIRPHLFGRLHAPAQPSDFPAKSPSQRQLRRPGRTPIYRENVSPKSVFRHKCTKPYFFWRGPRGEKKSDLSSYCLPARARFLIDAARKILRAGSFGAASGLGTPAGSAGARQRPRDRRERAARRGFSLKLNGARGPAVNMKGFTVLAGPFLAGRGQR